jgi:CheY-like chemotaxis protein
VKKILLVDDDLSVLSMLSRALTSSYDVTTAHDGREALAVAVGKPLDLLITDYLMPEMTGDELIARLRVERPHLKALVITGHGDLLDREAPEWWHEIPHLAKPFRLNALRETIDGILAT